MYCAYALICARARTTDLEADMCGGVTERILSTKILLVVTSRE